MLIRTAVSAKPLLSPVRSESSPLASSAVRLRRGALALSLLGALAACEEKKPAPAATPPQPAAAAPAPAPEVRLLFIGGASGQLLPTGEGAEQRGGAAELLGYWVAEEKHCPGPLKEGQPSCPEASTLALATGDHAGGPAISSFFLAEPTAEVMSRMGFAASALGNHELDYDREQFLKNRAIGGFPYLAANLKVADPAVASKEMELPGFRLFERRGLKVGVVGLTSSKTVNAVMSGRAAGLAVSGTEETLAAVVPQVRQAGAELVVVVADMCVSELKPLVEAHPDWKLGLVVGGRCPSPVEPMQVAGTTLASLERGFGSYLRARVELDASKSGADKVKALEARRVEVKAGAGAPAPEAEAAKLVAKWKQQVDVLLGQEIGYTKAGLAQDSAEMARWVAGAVRERLNADVAILNRKGIRASLQPGKVTRGSVYSVLPFENSVLMVRLKGEDLARQMSNPEALVSGFTKDAKGNFKDPKGKALDPKKDYVAVTVEYLYFGGDGFEFEKLDPEPRETGMVWQTPVVEWTRAKATSEQQPLEALLR